jgi:hypothetical protein
MAGNQNGSVNVIYMKILQEINCRIRDDMFV